MVDPLFQHDDSRQAKFKRLDGAWATIEINAGSTTGNSRIAFTDPDTENQVAQNTADGMIDYEHSTDALRFYTDQSLAAQFTSSGNLLFPDGQGIDFSSSEGSGASSSVLDDYEEGTWTAAINYGSPTGTTATLSESGGTYTKVGRLVTVNAEIDVSNTNSGSGNIYILGLPFTVADLLSPTGLEANGKIGYFTGFSSGVNSMTVGAENSTTYMGLYGLTSSTQTAISTITAAIMGTGELRLSLTYFTT
jgi:hypothetical protein